jgi:hypothetical protein
VLRPWVNKIRALAGMAVEKEIGFLAAAEVAGHKSTAAK